jgi:hypothetical protein
VLSLLLLLLPRLAPDPPPPSPANPWPRLPNSRPVGAWADADDPPSAGRRAADEIGRRRAMQPPTAAVTGTPRPSRKARKLGSVSAPPRLGFGLPEPDVLLVVFFVCSVVAGLRELVQVLVEGGRRRREALRMQRPLLRLERPARAHRRACQHHAVLLL